jgi:hypothetical protein
MAILGYGIGTGPPGVGVLHLELTWSSQTFLSKWMLWGNGTKCQMRDIRMSLFDLSEQRRCSSSRSSLRVLRSIGFHAEYRWTSSRYLMEKAIPGTIGGHDCTGTLFPWVALAIYMGFRTIVRYCSKRQISGRSNRSDACRQTAGKRFRAQ